MKYKLYSMKDMKAEAFGPLMTVPTKGLLLRNLADTVSDPRNVIAQYPADFVCYEIGEFDPSTGECFIHSTPAYVVSVADVARQVNEARMPKPVEPEKPQVEAERSDKQLVMVDDGGHQEVK